MKTRILISLLATILVANSATVFASAMHPTLKDEYQDSGSNNGSNSYSSSLSAPRLTNVFATKDAFDPGINEITQIVFTLSEDADTKITIYRNAKKIDTIYDEQNLDAGTYAAEWDGDGVETDVYTYKISAENSKGNDSATGDIQVTEEEKSTGKPNITRDEIQDLPYFPQYNNLNIDFKLDRDADVTLEIRLDDEVIATPVTENSLSGGQSELYWNGEDKYGDQVEDGIYTYKLIAANSKGKDVEFGNFEIQDSYTAKNPAGKCGDFKDVSKDYNLCDSILWAKDNGIFEGYSDSSFGPEKAITRAEALKVIIETLNINTQDYHGEFLNFSDVAQYDWYSEYLKAAIDLGIVRGYSDGTFRPNNQVSRIEAITMLLNAAMVKDHIVIPSNTYGQPYYDTPNTADTKWYISFAWYTRDKHLTNSDVYLYPDYAMTRASMADMLYRYSNI